jgi:hypothetical protein
LKLFHYIYRACIIVPFLHPVKQLRAFGLRPVIGKDEFRAFQLLVIDTLVEFDHFDDIAHGVFLLNIELVLLDEFVFEQVDYDLFL